MVNIPKFFKEGELNSARLVLPLLPLRDIVVFPFMVAPLFVGRARSVNALTEAMNGDKTVFLSTQKKAGIDNPGEQDISEMGTIGKVLQLLRLPGLNMMSHNRLVFAASFAVLAGRLRVLTDAGLLEQAPGERAEYLPTARSFTIDMARIAGGSVKAWWFRPVIGFDTLFPGLVDWFLKVAFVKRSHQLTSDDKP